MLSTLENVLGLIRHRLGVLELAVRRVQEYAEGAERLQDRVNLAVAARLAELERRLPPA